LGWVERYHNFYSIFRVEGEKLIFLGFMKSDDRSYSCYVAIFSAEDFSFVDSIQINQISKNGDPYQGVIASIINKQSIKSFRYEYITEELNAPYKTKITSSHYKFDFVNNRFSKPDEKIDFSPCSLNDIFFNNKNCAEDDPMNKKE